MNKKIWKFLSNFIPSKRKRHLFRKRMALKPILATNNVHINDIDFERIDLHIEGKNNLISIGKLKSGSGKISIYIWGSDNQIIIGDNFHISGSLNINLSCRHPTFRPISNVEIRIGNHTSVESADVYTYNSNTKIEVGNDCMLSYGIVLYNTDAHPIFDRRTGELKNYVGTLHIGDHVWIGMKATILKNTFIADDCVIGCGSVVSGRFERSHCAIAGNPAKVVTKQDDEITWKTSDQNYIANVFSHIAELKEGNK